MSEPTSEKLFVARESDLSLLRQHFDAVVGGAGRTLHLDSDKHYVVRST